MKLEIICGQKPLKYSFENSSMTMQFENSFEKNIENLFLVRNTLRSITGELTKPLSLACMKYLRTFNAYLRFLHPELFKQFLHIANSQSVEKVININFKYYEKRYLKSPTKDLLNYLKDLQNLQIVYIQYKTLYLNLT